MEAVEEKEKNLASRWGFILACSYILSIPISFLLLILGLGFTPSSVHPAIGVLLFVIFCLIGGPLSLILSIIGLVKAKHHEGRGKKLAIASLIILLLSVMPLLYFLTFWYV